ncbi:hypothetical protein HMPREF0345_1554 [Enterococcus faecalis ATCC 29200]|jgi:hypothetical protein|nr:hypothetical protein HMPREF0348_2776 [Enterococcus faecalis TX0104]EEI57816.1 hypothetical protein HMPREF0346_1183 [Enterococcus faecalis EnGen0297]EEN71575.1 hypothetical protein HMPREF0345_1554 [Enterococcus faecalis ATCC 29200]EEN75778.1 hypothetical protein HMPREF0349_0315 [Enterococcus faecalis TX1322]
MRKRKLQKIAVFFEKKISWFPPADHPLKRDIKK